MTGDSEQPFKATTRLYDGEKEEMIAGHRALTKFVPADGDASKPLVAFIPGLAYNARISYGGHKGGRSEDFLAHWFRKHGFPFLGISYPLDTDPEVMPPTGSELLLREWGRQAAVAIRRVVDEHGLSPKVVILAWSMGGKTLGPVTTEATALQLTISLFVSLAATPALWGLRKHPPRSHITLSPAGYWDCSFLHDRFLSQLLEQNQINNGRTIIDEALYKHEYFGSTPVGSGGWGFRYDKEERKLVEDKWALLEEGRVDDYGQLPAMAAIYPTSPLDWQHSILDKINWGYLMVQKFVADVQKAKETHTAPIDGTGEKHPIYIKQERNLLERLRAFIYEIPNRMVTGVEGNHFFFVGAKGAKQTAETVMLFIQEAENIQLEFGSILECTKVV